MPEAIPYDLPGPLSTLSARAAELTGVADGCAIDVCRPVPGLVIQPDEASAVGLPDARLEESNVRPSSRLFDVLLSRDAAPLTSPREPEKRVVGTCRHFALMACALLRHRSVPARVRCGFATYFQPSLAVDHWIVEYQEPSAGHWVRVDAEVLGGTVIDNPDQLTPEQFLSGTEAWSAYRRGDVDASVFGVYGTANFGAAEIRGNAVRDLAALNRLEMLPWDEWGRMTEAYDGRTGTEYDALLDAVAQAAGMEDLPALRTLGEHPDLQVPADMVC